MPTEAMHERLDINMHFTNNSNIVEKSNFNMSQHRAEVCARAHNTHVSAPMFCLLCSVLGREYDPAFGRENVQYVQCVRPCPIRLTRPIRLIRPTRPV